MTEDSWLVAIPDIAVSTYIGVYDWEHEKPQVLNVALELVPAQPPVGGAYLDYAAVVTRVREFASLRPRRLLEEFASGLADILSHEFKTTRLKICVTKTIDIDGQVSPSVTLERRGADD